MCLQPIVIRKDKIDQATVPCSRCPLCIARRASAWSFRLMQENKVSQSSYFITLTYDSKYVPITRNGFMELKKRDLQLFFKKLRKAHAKEKNTNVGAIRYYAAGEYGERTKRPHYHIIIYNAKLELIQPAWGMGQIHYGEVTGASVGYTLKYMQKIKKYRIPQHRNDDRQPEFALMSKRLGASYLTQEIIKWHGADYLNRMYCVAEGGIKLSMPRYYKDILYQDKQVRKEISEYQKSVIQEKEWKILEKSMETVEKWENYQHNKKENVKAAFERMRIQSLKKNKV